MDSIMDRSEYLDSIANDVEAKAIDIMKALNNCDYLRFDQKSQIVFWGDALYLLEQGENIIIKDNSFDEQESFITVHKREM